MKTQPTNEVNLLLPILVGYCDLMDDFTPIETARALETLAKGFTAPTQLFKPKYQIGRA